MVGFMEYLRADHLCMGLGSRHLLGLILIHDSILGVWTATTTIYACLAWAAYDAKHSPITNRILLSFNRYINHPAAYPFAVLIWFIPGLLRLCPALGLAADWRLGGAMVPLVSTLSVYFGSSDPPGINSSTSPATVDQDIAQAV